MSSVMGLYDFQWGDPGVLTQEHGNDTHSSVGPSEGRQQDGERRYHLPALADRPGRGPVADGPERREVEAALRGLIRPTGRTLETDRWHLVEDFEFLHTARKAVRVGSVGTRACVLLFLGRHG